MKVLLTGGTGFIGRAVLDEAPEKAELIVSARADAGASKLTQRYSLRIAETDYSEASLRLLVQGCDALVHLAARRQTGGQDMDCLANASLDFRLFHACKKEGVRNVVFASTRGVYGKSPIPWKEETPLRPDNPYSLAKCQSELTATYFNLGGMRIKSLRIAQVLGLGERENSMISTFWRKAIARETIEITVSGEILREYIYSRDLARAIWAAVSKPGMAGIFNVGSGQTCSIHELAAMMNNACQNQGNIKVSDHPKELHEQSLMDSKLFRETFSWCPYWTLEEAVFDMRSRMMENRGK